MNKNQPIHIIYIPGFGGKYDNFRLWAIKKWKYFGASAEFLPMKWGQGTLEQKLAAIDDAIDRASDKRVVLVGESAGGSMVIHTMARRGDTIYKAMTVCGKNGHPEKVGQIFYDRSSAFKESMELIVESASALTSKQKAEFVSIHPLYDELIPREDMLLEGCRQVRLLSIGHLFSIILALTVYAPVVIFAAKRPL